MKSKIAKYSFVVKPNLCDIFKPDLNLIIEYNGDYWHCNPKKYNSEYLHPHKKKTAKEIWTEDKVRIDYLKNLGYNLEVIWESDFKNDNKIINIILDKYAKSN
jgi:G:T-mismatch repair DNA endonuclease (very short patch repair protein)